MGKVYVGDVGTDIILDTGVALAGYTTLQIKYKKPSGNKGYWTATITDSTKAKYTVQAGDLDESGTWTFQVYAVLTDWTGHGEEATAVIYDPTV